MQKLAFTDEYGNQMDFIVKAKFNLGYSKYIALLPAEEIQSPTYILRVETDNSGNEILVGIDEDELEEVSDAFEAVLNDTIQ
ncbi:MAG: DUF1292 domain-containing protein [Tissierellia bacterium]|jgi:hypothetical protein|nr:DUF1292 domain-containing protein [Tissierellia bacterium]